MTIGFDKIQVNQLLDLSLPMREGSGLATHDRSKNHYSLALVHHATTPMWTTIPETGLSVLQFGSVFVPPATWSRRHCIGAAPALNYTNEDFWMAVWVKPAGYGTLLCRGQPNMSVDGWEFEITSNRALALNMFRGGPQTTVDTPDLAVTYGQWQLAGVQRNGAHGYLYLNAENVTEDSALVSCLTSARNLYMGVQEGGAQYNITAQMWNPRAGPGVLSAEDWREMFHREGHLLGV